MEQVIQDNALDINNLCIRNISLWTGARDIISDSIVEKGVREKIGVVLGFGK